jgi:hypothetical protein
MIFKHYFTIFSLPLGVQVLTLPFEFCLIDRNNLVFFSTLNLSAGYKLSSVVQNMNLSFDGTKLARSSFKFNEGEIWYQ